MITSGSFLTGLFLTMAIGICSCKKSQDSTVNPPPSIDTAQAVITEKGIPFGDIVTAAIGPDGGTITAADGGATLVVPRGALTASTVISIQAVNNTLPMGLGDHAYQFLPEGLVFSVPARLTLKYDTTGNGGPSSAGLVVANQEADGSWMHNAEVAADENKFTLTADMEHFSAWIVARAATILPQRSAMELGSTASFFLLQMMEKYVPAASPGVKRKKAKIKLQSFQTWQKENAPNYYISGWRLNYNNAPGSPIDGLLKIDPSNTNAMYTSPTDLPPVRNPVLIQAVVSNNNIGIPNLIASAVVFVRKNGYLKATIGGQVFNYVQHIGEPSTSKGIVNASVLPLMGGTKLVVNALDVITGSGAGIYCFAKKGSFKIVYTRDVEFVGASTSGVQSWKQEYYTRENGNGTTRCFEYGPKYSDLVCTLTEFTGGFSDWVSGTITGILYDDTDVNRLVCQSSDSKSIKIEFVLKGGY